MGDKGKMETDNLPLILKNLAARQHEWTGMDHAMTVTAALPIMAFAVQGRYRVKIPFIIGEVPLNTFALILADSGMMKSHLTSGLVRSLEDEIALKGVAYQAEMKIYREQMKAFERAKADIVKEPDAISREKQLVELFANEPVQPRNPDVITKAPSQVGLLEFLASRDHSTVMINPEAAGYFSGSSFSKDFANKSAAELNSLWNSEPIIRQIAGVDVAITKRNLSLVMMIQKAMLAGIGNKNFFRQSGLSARMLMIDIPSKPPKRWDHINDPTAKVAWAEYDRAVSAFDRRVVEHYSKGLRYDDRGNLEYDVLEFSAEAAKRFNGWQLSTGGDLRDESDDTFAKKILEHAARIAGILAAFDRHHEIDLEHIEAGIHLAEFYARQWNEFDGVVSEISTEVQHANAIVRTMRKRAEETSEQSFTSTDVRNIRAYKGCSPREKEAIREALADHDEIIVSTKKLPNGNVVTVYNLKA